MQRIAINNNLTMTVIINNNNNYGSIFKTQKYTQQLKYEDIYKIKYDDRFVSQLHHA